MDKLTETLSFCPVHTTEDLRFYCNDCKTVICDDCVIGDHDGHRKVKLKDYGDQRREFIQSTAKEARDVKLPKLQELIDKIEHAKISVNKSIDKNISEIRLNKELIKTVFDEVQDELINRFQEARGTANGHFDEIISCHTERCEKIKETTDWIEANASTMSPSEIAIRETQLVNNLCISSLSEKVPNVKPPIYKFNQEYVKKENLQYLLGQMDYGDYEPIPHTDIQSTKATVQLPDEDDLASDFDESKQPQKTSENDTKYEVEKVFQCRSQKFSHIVPKKSPYEAWIIGEGIADLDFKSTPASLKQLISSLDGLPTVTGRNQKNELVVGISGKKSIFELHLSTGLFGRKNHHKLKTFHNLDSDHIKAICVPKRGVGDLISCFEDRRSSEESHFCIRWIGDEEQCTKPIRLSPDTVNIKYPIHICENINGDICITCSPANETSWIVLIDKQGKQIMRYPSQTKHDSETKTKLYSFLGAGFLNNGLITVLDRIQFRQHLITAKGELQQIDHYDNEPSCMGMDEYDNIWIGFVGGKVQIMNYKNRYEPVAS